MTIYLVIYEDHWGQDHIWAYTDANRATVKANAVMAENSMVEEQPWSVKSWFRTNQTYREIDGSEHVCTRKVKVDEEASHEH